MGAQYASNDVMFASQTDAFEERFIQHGIP